MSGLSGSQRSGNGCTFFYFMTKVKQNRFERCKSHQNVSFEDVAHVTDTEDFAFKLFLSVGDDYAELLF